MRDIDFAFYSDAGGRKNNEDTFLSKQMSGGYLFVVADGLGGHDDGEMASCLAVNSIKEFLANNDAADVKDAVCFANDRVLEMQVKHYSKMKTTIALAYITKNKTVIAHVGDSRIYMFKNGKIVHQTMDHSASQLAVLVGEISPEDIRNHEDRNVLLRALGVSDKVKVEFVEFLNCEYEALLLCSDGFWEYVLESEMESELCNSKDADEWLYKMRVIQLSRAPKTCDNNTAIAVML